MLLHWITEEEQSTRSLVLPYDQYHSPLSLSQVNRVLCRISSSSPNNNILIIVLISRHAPKEILSSNRSLLQQFLYLFYHSWLILLSLSSSPSLFTSAVQNQSCLCRGVYYIITISYQSLLSPLGSQHPPLLSNSVHNSTSIHLSSSIASSRCPCIVNIINGGSELQSSSLRGFTSGSIVSSFFLVYYSHDPTCIICVCVCVQLSLLLLLLGGFCLWLA